MAHLIMSEHGTMLCCSSIPSNNVLIMGSTYFNFCCTAGLSRGVHEQRNGASHLLAACSHQGHNMGRLG